MQLAVILLDRPQVTSFRWSGEASARNWMKVDPKILTRFATSGGTSLAMIVGAVGKSPVTVENGFSSTSVFLQRLQTRRATALLARLACKNGCGCNRISHHYVESRLIPGIRFGADFEMTSTPRR